MDSHSELQAAKKTRASKPKVKSGCVTCKTRRVKCDETKPACLRCINYGRECEGYPPQEEKPAVKEPFRPAVPQRILPKDPNINSTIVAPPWQPSPDGGAMDETERYYIRIFQEDTAFDLSSGFDPALWNQLVIQACGNPCIMKLTVAVAALGRAVKLGGSSSPNSEAASHRQYALQEYDQAIEGMRKYLEMTNDSIRFMLVAGILIFCFENMHNDTSRAVRHIHSALDLMQKQMVAASQTFRGLKFCPSLLIPALPEVIDDDLVLAFMRLDGPALALLSQSETYPPPPPQRLLGYTIPSTDYSIPAQFANISEARIHLEHLKHHVLPYQTVTAHQNSPGRGKEKSAYRDWVPLASESMQWHKPYDLQFQEQGIATRLNQWRYAFNLIFTHSLSPEGSSHFVGAATLQIQALSLDLLLWRYAGSGSPRYSGSTTPPSMPYPTPTAQTILSLTHRLISHPLFARCFVFDVGIIPSLYMILETCPDRLVQGEVVDLLMAMAPRKEGVWDSRLLAEVGKQTLSLHA